LSTFGKRLRAERNKIGLSQTEFAALGGGKKHAQINYEADKSSPTCEFLSKLTLHGVDVVYVLTGERAASLPLPDAKKLPPRLRQRLSDAIETIEEGLAALDRTAAPAIKAQLVLAAYDILSSEGEAATAEIIRLLRA
jgi:transcriptional regulator with XRE-family HTH domain